MIMSAIVGVALAGSLSLPAAANATTIHPGVGAAHLAASATPDKEGECLIGPLPAYGVHLFTEENAGGDEMSCACTTDTEYNNIGNYVRSVQNACDYRIYLQQNYGGTTGWSYCISGGSIRNDIGMKYQEPASMKVGASEDPC
jgi:hypothetical protein